jgi:single-strand DNA-binding protein
MSTALFGRLTAKPEVKNVGESQVSNFTVAKNVGYGEKQQTLFMNCSIWGKSATALATHFDKGNRIVVYGELEPNKYEGKNGTVDSVKLNVRSFDFVETKAESGASASKEDVPF